MNLVEEFYLDDGRHRKNLEGAKPIIEVWANLLFYKKHLQKIEELEQLITQAVKQDWDNHTVCTFDRENFAVLVKNEKTLIEKEIKIAF